MRMHGETRVETAVVTAKTQFATGANEVVLARADVAADSVSAAPLARSIGAPILLTQSDTLHPATEAELKRLGAKTVYLMGGHVALSPKVEAAVKALGVEITRVAGVNRAATAVATAEILGAKDPKLGVLVTDGNDWQTALIAAPAAAKHKDAVLLTAGEVMPPETKAYLDAHQRTRLTVVGNGPAKLVTGASTVVRGADITELGLNVATTLFERKAPVVGVATTADFADALVAGAHLAQAGGPLFLVGQQTPPPMNTWVKGQAELKTIYIYGGPARISDDQAAGLTK